MRPTLHLDLLASHAEKRLSHLHSLIDGLPSKPTGADDRVVAFAAIEAVNTWATFARSFYLSCVFRAVRANGSRVSLGKNAHVRNEEDAIDFAVRTVKPGWAKSHKPPWSWRDEPVWYDPNVLLRLVPELALSNTAEIFAAFGVSTTAFVELPRFRNFFAHRNEDTASKTRRLIADNYKGHGFTDRTAPAEFLCTRLVSRPQSILADYIDDLRSIMSLMPL